MGGYDGVSDTSHCELYDPNINKWQTITAMGTKRSCHGVGQLNGLIYCIGGQCLFIVTELNMNCIELTYLGLNKVKICIAHDG